MLVKLKIFPKFSVGENNKNVYNQDLVCECLWHSTTWWHGVTFSTETNRASHTTQHELGLLSLRHFCIDTQHVDRQTWRHHRIEIPATTIGVTCTLEARITRADFKRKHWSHKVVVSTYFKPLKKSQTENFPNKGDKNKPFWPPTKPSNINTKK